MRIAIIGGGEVSLQTAHLLIDRGHEVIIIDQDRDRIESYSGEMDCSFLHGDGSRPNVLRDVGPDRTDLLFCLTDNDQDNILGSLVGRSLGFERIVTSLEDSAFEPICQELGLEDVIVPTQTIARYLADMAHGRHTAELTSIIKDEARLFSFNIREKEAGKSICDLDLPDCCRLAFGYRDGKFGLFSEDSTVREGDELVLTTHADQLEKLREQFRSGNSDG